MKKILLLLFCLLAFPVVASHIVGGEFELIYISKNRYRLNLILYFDEKFGSQGAKDPSVTARIFRKRDNASMMIVTLDLRSQTPVSYTQPECSNGEVVTSKLTYSTEITLSDSYNDSEGYYISWERCCRNYSINNIYSEDPQAGSNYAGQTFYLEIPPVILDGNPFVNSSPRLFPPLSDYACPRRPYYVDFAGTDDDGDSLVYSLVTPLNTKSADALPPGGLPRPRPYPEVKYRPPFGPSNILGGQPDLAITQEGFLTVTPTQQGLFVFAVRCEEFRDGRKIGELRRDFQMLVLDRCPVADPPKIKGKMLTDAEFRYEDVMSVSFSNDVSDTERCIQVQVSDPDASKIDDNFRENVTIKAIPLNFKRADMPNVLPAVKSATLVNGSTVTFDICFKECPPIFEPYQIGIIAYDDACSLPLSDTLRITVNQELPENSKPFFNLADVTEKANEGDTLTWEIVGTDLDGQDLSLGILVDGFRFEDVGMSLTTKEQAPGHYKGDFVWDTRCDFYDFTRKTNFNIIMLLEDADVCKFTGPDTLIFNLSIDLPGNNDPIISTDLTPEELQNGITRKIFETIDFNVMGDDLDLDTLDLTVTGVGFALNEYNIEATNAFGMIGHVQTPFHWNITCANQNLENKSEFEFIFVVVDDNNKCRFKKTDTLTVKVKLEPPDNNKPDLEVINTNDELLFENNTQSLFVGQQISLALIAKDSDRTPVTDRVFIEIIDARGNVEPAGYEFAPAEGEGIAQTTFAWKTDCPIFQSGVYENNYTFRFKTQDNRCVSAKADTVEVDFIIRDIDAEEEKFIPPNFISPNGDERNEFFAMVRINPQTFELESILPKDNCVGRFLGISIYNRWGGEVFHSGSREFRWHPVNEASGIYFYALKYSNRDYKGSITLRN